MSTAKSGSSPVCETAWRLCGALWDAPFACESVADACVGFGVSWAPSEIGKRLRKIKDIQLTSLHIFPLIADSSSPAKGATTSRTRLLASPQIPRHASIPPSDLLLLPYLSLAIRSSPLPIDRCTQHE